MKNKMVLKEYYEGSPDTIYEYSDEDNSSIADYGYRSSRCISFGYFQTSIDGKKEFISSTKSHYDIANDAALKLIGNAIYSEYVDDDFVIDFKNAIYINGSAYTGRIFLDPKVVTTWYAVSSDELVDLLERLGGVEKYLDYYYVIDGNDGPDNVTVRKYIASGYPSNERNKQQMDGNAMNSVYVTNAMVKIVKEANYQQSSSKLANKTSKLGKMTIAQYNSLIRQESKKPNKTLNTNKGDMKKNKYQEEFSNYIEIMNEALKRNDFKAYDVAKSMLDETIDECKEKNALLSEMKTSNFGILNHIFEEQLPTLFKQNKKAVRDVVKLIKEDNNLKNEFAFYNAVKTQFKGNVTNIVESKEALNKLADVALKGIDQKTVIESNKKLRKAMIENNITPSDFINDEDKKLYESCHMILTHKKTPSNMLSLIESYDNVSKYMEEHKNDKLNENKNVDSLIEDFEDKLKSNLNESEISFVQQITDFRTPIAEKRKERMFNKLKEDCLKAIGKMLSEDKDNVELNSLSKQLNEMKFNNETIVKDVAKLLEIRDILMDD